MHILHGHIAIIDGLGLHDHTHTAPKGRVVYLPLLVVGVIPNIMAGNI